MTKKCPETITMHKPELLAPAGNFEKLKIAIHYGADAVYLAGKDFSLRNFSGNFTDQELSEAVQYAHTKGVKVYLACNIYSRNNEQERIKSFLENVGRTAPDAVIISDPGILMAARQIIPHIDIHLSTQSNTTNYNTAIFWKKLGVKRVNLARELSLDEIRDIVQQSDIETETFIHGAMCVSYSGRCLLSNVMTKRDSNRGLCSHPCRWKYAVVEEMRPNEFHPLIEDERGAYIFNSKDLCMIEHIPQLVNTGITSLKIEGRMKGINYLASVVKTYRNAIDAYFAGPGSYQVRPEWRNELYQVYHRAYCTGFYFGHPDNSAGATLNQNNTHEGKIHSFIGKVLDRYSDGKCLIEIRNKLTHEDTIEILRPEGPAVTAKILSLSNEAGDPIENAQPNTCAILQIDQKANPRDIIRKI